MFFLFLIGVALSIGAFYFVRHQIYLHSAYFKATKRSYKEMSEDLGFYGEYLTYKYLRGFEKLGCKFLFNLYIPKENGDMTEIDVLMLCNKGIFVFESKNYSGWIFGSEDQKMWYQTLPTGHGKSHKEEFFNPIMQNYYHIRHLREYLGEKIPMWSIIAFSDRCELKNIRLKSKYIHVINRYDIEEVVGEIWDKKKDVITDQDVEALYNKLYPLTQVDEKVKQAHIARLRKKWGEENSSISANDVKADQKNDKFFEKIEDGTEVVVLSEIEKILSVSEDVERTVESNKLSEIEKILDENIYGEPSERAQMDLKCPRCGHSLVLRTTGKGEHKGRQFYGCSSFPKCRYIQNVEERK